MTPATEHELSEALRRLFLSLAARAASERLTRLIEDLEDGRAAPSGVGGEPH